MKKVICAILFVGFVLTACDEKRRTDGYVPVEGVSLNVTEQIMGVGHELQLQATVIPEDATDKTVVWSSDDESIVTVDEEGTVSAHAQGQATVTVTAEDGGFTAECLVTVESVRDVYAAGFVTDQTTRKSLGACWKNGEELYRFELTGSALEGRAESIYVTDRGDVYVSGYEIQEGGSTRVAYIYKNGEILYQLSQPESGVHCLANKVYVSEDGSVYAAGFESDIYSNTSVGLVWKDGQVLNTYADEGKSIYTNSMDVQGDDIYVAGYYTEGEFSIPFYYKNEERVDLMSPSTAGRYPAQGEAYDIVVTDNGDVYVAGYARRDEDGQSNATVWKNGEMQYWGEAGVSSTSNAIDVQDGAVYVCGHGTWDTTLSAAYWIDGVMYPLLQNNTDYYDIVVVDGDVYTGGDRIIGDAGNISFNGFIWKNGEVLFDISEEGWGTTVQSIFVK